MVLENTISTNTNSTTCPLCQRNQIVFYCADSKRPYLHCKVCDLVFVPANYHISSGLEKAEYDKHQNSAEDYGYRTFLSRLSEPLLERLEPRSKGLDFGCGPGPALPAMLAAHGHRVEIYDPFYAHYPEVLERQYDFVTTTEVFEHLREPARTLNQLWSLVKPGGVLGVMTKLVANKTAFEKWHYKNDPTHIIFFSKTTMQWLADFWCARQELVAGDAIIFRKPDKPPEYLTKTE